MSNTKSIENFVDPEKVSEDNREPSATCSYTENPSHDLLMEAGSSTSLQSATNPCCNETKENKFPNEVLKQKLQEVYRDVILPKVSWLNSNIQEYFMEPKLTDSVKSIRIEDIFNEVKNDEQPMRILIEGQPGCGKTTLAHKIGYDWAMPKKKYIKPFKFVFLLPLRQLENRSFEETITELGKKTCGLKENQNAIEIVKNHQNNTLFVLDGLDEVSLEGRKSILKTLYKKVYKEVTVIIFSRTGLFNECKQLLSTDYVDFCITKNSDGTCSPIPTIFDNNLKNLVKKVRKHVLTLPEVNLLDYPLGKPFQLKEIFNPVKKNQASRILIEGQNKFEKTTMAIKLAYDWAVKKKYIEHFRLALFVPLKNIQSIEEELIKIKKQCKLPRYFNIIERINDCQNDILFILDGLDEISLEKQNEILQIFYKQKYSKATVVLLCKTGLFKSIKDECAQMCKNADMEIDHHKLVSLLELTNIEKREFLKRFYPQQLIDNLPEPLELFNYLEEYSDIESLQSRTELYKVLFNFVIKHSCNQQDFDLFHFHGGANKIQKLIQEFGNFSLQNKNLTDNNLQFDCTNLTEQMYKTGFLLHQKSKSHYEVIHYSIMEFACAYDGWMQFQLNNSNWLNDFLDPIAKLYFKTKGTSLVLPFLAGLMKSDLNTLLQKMMQFRHWFLSNFHLTVKFFKCCAPINDYKVIKNITYFIPAEIDVRYVQYVKLDNSLKIYESLLTYGFQCGKIKFVKTDFEASSTILSKISIKMPSLKIFLNFKEVWLTAITKKNCYVKDIFQYFLYPKNDFFQCISKNKLNFLFCSQIDSFALALNKSKSVMMLDKIIQNKTSTFKNINFRYLRIQIENEEEKQIIIRMLKGNGVQFLELIGKSELDMSDFYNAVVHSDNLTSVDMFNVTIDLYDLTNGGLKKYKYINLNNCKVTCKEPLLNSKCCDFLSFNKFYEAICEFEPIYLDCESEIIYKLMQHNSEWVGFQSVQHLTLDAMCSNEIFEKSLTPWKKLDTLFIRLWDECNEDVIRNITQCIKKYKITKFIFKYDLQPVTKVFEYMNETLRNESVKSLKTVDLIHFDLDSDEFKSEIDALLDGLGTNWEIVNLISDFISDEILTFFDLSRFYVNFYMYGSDDCDPEQYKIAYNNEMQSELYTFSITRKQE